MQPYLGIFTYINYEMSHYMYNLHMLIHIVAHHFISYILLLLNF